jgi:phosphoenolpyruvate synthase/pyruvate phosphate dikinase
MKSRIKDFNEISINDVDTVGGKNASYRRNVYYKNFD